MPVGDNFGNDLFGSDISELYLGLGGFDLLFASGGNDTLDGGSDTDVAIYDTGQFTNGVFINNTDTAIGTILAFSVDKRGFGTDTLIDVSNFHGSEANDTIYVGGTGDTYTFDKAGDDLVVASQDPNANDDHNFLAGSGNDTLIGTVNRDEVDYRETGFDGAGPITQGVVVDLETGVATDGWGDTDTLISIERVEGTRFDDVMYGNDDRNDFEGFEGNDFFDGRGGDDDRVRYDEEPGGIDADLATGTVIDGYGDTDTLVNIERITGSQQADIIRGDDNDNSLVGKGGADLIEGRGGNDDFEGGAGNDTIDGGDGDYDRINYDGEDANGAVNVNLETGVATDRFGDTDTLSNIEQVIGTELNDTIIGDDAENYIEGGGGDDNLAGGAGRDSFRGSEGNDTIDGGESFAEFNGGDRMNYDEEHERGGSQGVNVDLGTGVAIDTFGNTDTLISIEEIRGSVFNDTIVGTEADEDLVGREGDDLIISGGGDDYLEGGAGDDTITGGVGGEYIRPGLGTDIINAGEPGTTREQGHLVYRDSDPDNAPNSGINVVFTSEQSGTVVDYGGSTDTFTGIEIVEGTHTNDTFIGAAGDQEFRGYGGDDFFDGGDGDRDELDYRYGDEDLAIGGITVDMVAGTATDNFGGTDTFINIEDIQGSINDDVITGDTNRNSLRGEAGDDLIDSFGGVDNNVEGGQGNDTLIARGDEDWVSGGDGNDLITFFGEGGGANAGLGSDTIIGGTEGFFSIDYHGIGTDLIIDTATGTTQFVGSSDVDTFTNIRNTEGGDGNDILLGDDNEEFQRFRTSLGDDFIDGRGGFDQIEYDDRSETSVIIDFTDSGVIDGRAYTGTVRGDYAGTDYFINIEQARGSDGDDQFIGNDEDNRFRGEAGVDNYIGNGGFDSISFSGDRFDNDFDGSRAVTVDLEAGTNTDGYGNQETNSGIERVVATDFNDSLYGANYDDRLIGLLGDDILDARDGNDGLYAGGGADTVTGGAGSDAFGGRLWELDGDTFTDFSAEDRLQVFDEDFNFLDAEATIVGDEMRIDVDGDGVADATVTLTNGFTGPVTVETEDGLEPTVFSVEDAGVFTAAVDEGGTVANVTIKRSGDLTSTATVQVTMTGTGINPVTADDVTTPFDTPITITFVPGQEQIIYQIGIVDDLDVESFEDLAFTLSNPTSSGDSGAEIDGAETNVRILDNDIAPSVRIDGEKRQEDGGELIFTVSRTGDTSDAITIPYAIASAGGLQGAEADDLVGGLPQSGTVVIEAGETEATFTVEVAPDTVAELHDDIVATISVGDDWPAGLTIGIAQATGSIRNDDGIPPLLPVGATGSNYGDPHIVTLDGLAYDFQAVGEFTLIEAVNGDPLNVQVRFQPVEGSQVASQTTAVATSLGAARVVIDVDGSSLVSVDGAAFDLNSAVGGANVGDGELYYDGEAITVVYANGEQLRVDLYDGFVSTSVSIAAGRDVAGLLGNADGDASNDLALRDGTVLTQPVAFDVLYGAFADDWRISDATSLFDYAAGQGTADFTDLNFPTAGLSLDDFPIEVVAQAEAAAAGIEDPALRDAAILDYLVSGNAEFIDAAETIDEATTEMVETTEPTDAPIIGSGIGIVASQTEIVEGDSGNQGVSFTVYRTGDLSGDLTVAYTVDGTADATDFEGSLGGTLVFEDGLASQDIFFDIIGDAEIEANETLQVSLEIESGDAPVIISSSAEIDIINDDVEVVDPGPELNLVEGTAASDRLRGTDGDDLIVSLGGSYDILQGFDGADTFVFGAETSNGRRERDVIRDFDAEVDSLLLTDGATIGSIRETSKGVTIFFEDDRDAVYIRASDLDADDITIFYDDLTLA